MAAKASWRERMSIFGRRVYGALAIMIGMAATVARGGDDANWSIHGRLFGLFFVVFGVLFVASTVPRFRNAFLKWKLALSKNWLALLALYAACLLLTFGFMRGTFGLIMQLEIDKGNGLVRHGVQTSGRIVGFGQRNGQSGDVIFEFDANGRAITTSGYERTAAPRNNANNTAPQPRVGDPVRVVYDRRDPKHAVLGDVETICSNVQSLRAVQAIVPWIFSIFFFGMLLAHGVLPPPHFSRAEKDVPAST